MKNIILTIFALHIIVLATYTQQTEIVTFPANSFSFSKTTVNNTTYDVASVANGIADCSQPGTPQLPIVYLKFIVPRDMQVTSVSVSSSQKQAITGNFYLFPQQPSLKFDKTSVDTFANPIAAIYSTNNTYPAIPVTIESQGYSMGQNIVTLAIIPYEYQPLSRQISIYTQLTFSFQFTDVQDAPPLPEAKSYNREKICETYFRNTTYNFSTMYQPLPVANSEGSALKSLSEYVYDQELPDYVIYITHYII